MQTPKFNVETATGKALNAIYNALLKGEEVMNINATRYHCVGSSLPRRIKDLKDFYGVPVNTEMRTVGNRQRIAVYTIKQDKASQASIF